MTGEQRTLYRASAERRPKAAQRRGTASDVTRYRGVLAASLAAAVGFAAAAIALPPEGGHLAPGPLARPHRNAGVACASCHGEGFSKKGDAPLVPRDACARCHGEHGSRRPGHARALRDGALRCASCHAIHRDEQGVAFGSDGTAVRFSSFAEAAPEPTRFRTDHATTVALVAKAACARCHDANSPSDPAARCFAPGEPFVSCFDEHQRPLPDAPRDARGEPTGPPTGVCAAQHGTDRPAAWEAARPFARASVAPARAAGGKTWIWLAVAAACGALAFAFARAAAYARERSSKKAEGSAALEALARPAARLRLPQIDVSTCIGCSACVDACPYDVLEIERYVAVVARPEACCGLTLCEQKCPNGSLRITEGEPVGDRPHLDDGLQSLDMPGLYLAGDVTGLPLIKNAIAQGARAADVIAKDLGRAGKADGAAADLAVIGAGPAGLSAALRAKELGLDTLVFEQGSVAQSIRSFPRGKLVFDQPLELPVVGKLWLEESTKEELLSHWLRIVRREGVVICEDTRVVDLVKDGGTFVVTTEPREGGARTPHRARRILLAIGTRGTPRRLPFELAPEVEARVHYHLADAKSFERQRVVVVGLGDVAMEAAIALSRQPGTHVTVIHRGPGFTRGKSRNIAEVKRLVSAGRVAVRWSAEIAAVGPDRLELAGQPGGSLPYEAVFVFIGSIPPWNTLRAFGVRSIAEAQEPRRAEPAHASA